AARESSTSRAILLSPPLVTDPLLRAMPKIVIVGSGITGLAIGFRLRYLLPHAEIAVLEQAGRPGGTIWTERENGFQVEVGANGFLDSKRSTIELCRDLGIETELIPASEASRRNRFLLLENKLHPLPTGLFRLLGTCLLSSRGKLRLLA